MTDVTVIGGGPAGALAALLLARRGRRVTLVEQHRFPRDKVCGECISALGWDVLRRANLTETLRHVGAVPMSIARLHAPDGRHVSIALPAPTWGLSRCVMDDRLLRAAVTAGVDVRQPARGESLDLHEATPRVIIRDLRSNHVESLPARCVLVADGKSRLLPDHPAATDDFGLKAHFADLDAPRDAVELFGVQGHYGGVAPVEAGLWNVAFSVPRTRLAGRTNLDDLFFNRIVPENPTLRRYLHRAHRVGEWLTSPLPRFGVRRGWPGHAIPIGNAASAIEPIGGEGMGLALRSAELAADAVDRALTEGRPYDTRRLRREYRRLWNLRRYTCRFAALWVSRPRLCSAAVDLLAASAQASQLLFAALEKGSGVAPRRDPPPLGDDGIG